MSDDRVPMVLSAVKDGIVCPRCGCRHFRVVYTRRKPSVIMRLRECRHCGRRIVTKERA